MYATAKKVKNYKYSYLNNLSLDPICHSFSGGQVGGTRHKKQDMNVLQF